MNNQIFLMNEDQLQYKREEAIKVIKKDLQPEWIQQRTQGKTTLSYIGGHIVINLLNEAFGYQWSFEIVKEEIVQSIPKHNKWAKEGQPSHEPQPPVVKVLGRLTVPGMGIKEQYGSKVLIGGATEQESAFKSASTDALKKCASLFGIGIQLYGAFELAEELPVSEADIAAQYGTAAQAFQTPPVQPPSQPIQQQVPQQPVQPEYHQPQEGQPVLNTQPQSAPNQGAQTAQSAPVHQMQWDTAEITRLKDLKTQLGIGMGENEKLNPFVEEFLNAPGVTFQNVTPENIAAFNVFLQSKIG